MLRADVSDADTQHSTARDMPSAAAGKWAQEAAGSQGHAEAQPAEEAEARAARCDFPAQQQLRYPPGLLSGSTSDYGVTTTLSDVLPRESLPLQDQAEKGVPHSPFTYLKSPPTSIYSSWAFGTLPGDL